MLNALRLKEYKQLRKDDPRLTARYALETVRRHERIDAYEFNGDWYTSIMFQRDGWDIEIEIQPDDEPSGSFSDTEGAIINPEWTYWDRNRVSKYWSPESGETVASIAKWLNTSEGIARHQAHLTALRMLREDYRIEVSDGPQVVMVKASREGVQLGSASLGWCYVGTDYDLWDVVEGNALVDEAIEDANATLEKVTWPVQVSPLPVH